MNVEIGKGDLNYASPKMDSRFSLRSKIIVLLGIGSNCLLGGTLVAAVIYSYPVNHISFDLRFSAAFPATQLAIGVIYFAIKRGRIDNLFIILLITISALVMSESLIVDHFNLLDSYDIWIERRMPDYWQWS